MSVKELVEKAIAGKQIAIFSKSWCPYCNKAKALLKESYPDAESVVIELDERDDGSAIQEYLRAKTGQGTVPNIFIAQKHIGGCDDTFALHRKNGIAPLLKE